MIWISDLHEGVTNRDVAKLKAVHQATFKTSDDDWLSLEALFEKYDNEEKLFYLLYQDLSLRRTNTPNSWTHKNKVFHNFACLIEELIQTSFFEIPADWLWECLAGLAGSYVNCTNAKWDLLLQGSADLDSVGESELENFKSLFDYDVVESLMIRITDALKAAAAESDTAEEEVSPTNSKTILYLTSQAALVKLYQSVGANYRKLITQQGPNAKQELLLPYGARSMYSYARGIAHLLNGDFVNGARELTKSSKSLQALGERMVSAGGGDISNNTDFKDQLRDGLRPMCAKCDFKKPYQQVDLKEKLVDEIYANWLKHCVKQEILTTARMYQSVTLDTLCQLTSCNDIDLIREVVTEDENMHLQDDTVKVLAENKKESYADILKKQTQRTKDLMAQISKI